MEIIYLPEESGSGRGGYELRRRLRGGWGWCFCESQTEKVRVNEGQLRVGVLVFGLGWAGPLTQSDNFHKAEFFFSFFIYIFI